MGSETGSKWIGVLVLYFFIMTFLVGLISSVGVVAVDSATLVTGTFCDDPRNAYESYNINPVGFSDIATTFTETTKIQSSIECDESIGVINNETCVAISGCVWEDTNSWWQNLIDAEDVFTCTGHFDWFDANETMSGIPTNWRIRPMETSYEGLDYSVCHHPDVIENQTRCEQASCTWRAINNAPSVLFDPNNINLNADTSVFKSTWRATKDMFLFRFDFGFEDDGGVLSPTYFLTFLIFWLPLFLLLLAIYQMLPFT
jgi:hypothetical protein